MTALPYQAAADHEAILSHVQRYAGNYYPELTPGPISVSLLERHMRTRSALYTFRLAAPAADRLVVAKISKPFQRVARIDDATSFRLEARPYLTPPIDPARVPLLQYRGLKLMHERLSTVHDSRFGTIRPLDFIRDRRVMIMEHVGEPTISDVMRSAARLSIPSSPRALPTLMSNAGAWLRVYHELEYGTRLTMHGATREHFVEAIATFADYLHAAGGDRSFFRSLTNKVEASAESAIPDLLPLGLSHGDYAPRNVFAGRGNRITGFDALPRFRAPIYADLGRFIMGLRSAGLQVISLGLAYQSHRLEDYERSFLAGYFATKAPPLRAIGLYQLLILLDKWSALTSRSRPKRIRYRLEMAARGPLSHRHFRKEAERLLKSLEEGE